MPTCPSGTHAICRPMAQAETSADSYTSREKCKLLSEPAVKYTVFQGINKIL